MSPSATRDRDATRTVGQPSLGNIALSSPSPTLAEGWQRDFQLQLATADSIQRAEYLGNEQEFNRADSEANVKHDLSGREPCSTCSRALQAVR